MLELTLGPGPRSGPSHEPGLVSQAACVLTCATDSGKNWLKSSTKSGAELSSCVTCSYMP